MSIIDNTWKEHLESGKILSETGSDGRRLVFIHVKNQTQYYYRCIVFKDSSESPELLFNLESKSQSGNTVISVHSGDKYVILGHADVGMSERDFTLQAIEFISTYFNLFDSTIVDSDEKEIRVFYKNVCQDLFRLAHRHFRIDISVKNEIDDKKWLSEEDYEKYITLAKELSGDISKYRKRIDILNEDIPSTFKLLMHLLTHHISDLSKASELLIEYINLLKKFTAQHGLFAWINVFKLSNKISRSKKQCQLSGDRVTFEFQENFDVR